MFEEVGEQGAADGGLLIVEQAEKRGLEFGAEPFVFHGLLGHAKVAGVQLVSVVVVGEWKAGGRGARRADKEKD